MKINIQRFVLSILLISNFSYFFIKHANAEFRIPGKYSGVVLFDRWGGCYLSSGIYIMCISEKTKAGLHKYMEKAVEIDAKEVFQPVNPGDGRIGKYIFLGLIKKKGYIEKIDDEINIDGIRINATGLFGKKKDTTIIIEIVNTSKKNIKIISENLGITVFTKKNKYEKYFLEPSDGPSYALITRANFFIHEGPRWQSKGTTNSRKYFWTIGRENTLPKYFELLPGDRKKITLSFDFLMGEYDFICNYGYHERTIVSNFVSFDIDKKNGYTTEVIVKNR